MKSFAPYMDKLGRIGKYFYEWEVGDVPSLDFGDWPQRLGLVSTGRALAPTEALSLVFEFPTYLLKQIEYISVPGGFIRDFTKWNDPKDFSRDQMISLICGISHYIEYPEIKKVVSKSFWMMIKNFFRFPNGDLCSPEHFGVYFRAYEEWYMYPFLLISDLLTLGMSVIIAVRSHKDADNVGDDLNHCQIMIMALTKYPTPLIFVALYIYNHWSWAPPGMTRAEYAFEHYFRSDINPPFDDFFRPVLKHYLTWL